MARLTRIVAVWAIILAIAALLYDLGRDYVRKHPQDVPWTPLALDDPVGTFTLRKVNGLIDDPAQCRTLLSAARFGFAVTQPFVQTSECGFADGVRLTPAEGNPGYRPQGLIVSCPVAAGLAIFERQVLQPAARRHFGQSIASIDHAGSFSCRRIGGGETGRYSEHATADAVDITGFTLADGRRVSVLAEWNSPGPPGRFLREVRDGACTMFATVLSPDYNRAHEDHFHLDQARRGRIGSGFCR